MSKDHNLKLEGSVIQVLPNTQFKVKLDNGHELIAYLGGKLRKFEIRITMGDKVEIEVSPYDLSKGRIIRRN
jgi:translation initiation factor IF-1